MQVVSACELPVASQLWQAHASAWALTVVCRATFVLLPRESALAANQDAVAEEDDHWDADPARSLRVSSDLVPFKLRADVTLVGRAFAPRGEAVRSLVARLVVGEMEKSIEVHGDRYFDHDGALHDDQRWTSMPLLYERAAGGPGTVNPVGVRSTTDTYGRIALPNLQAPGLHIASASDHLEPIGFGPIAPSWPTRLEKIGRSATPAKSGSFPDDMDLGYFNHAPRDQQVTRIRENERIVLENLHPKHARLATNLPGLWPRATIERPSGTQEVSLTCDTLWIDTDRGLCTLTWRAQVPLESRREEGRVVISRGSSSAAEVPAIDEGGVTATMAPVRMARRSISVLPFVASQQAAQQISVPVSAPAPVPAAPSAQPARVGMPFAGTPSPTLPTKPIVPPAFEARPPSAPPPAPSWPAAPPPLATRPVADDSPWSVPDSPQPAMTVGQRASAETAQAQPAAPAARAPAQPEPPPAEAPKPAPRVEARSALHLLWQNDQVLPRLRAHPRFQPLIAALEDKPLDPELDEPYLAEDHVGMENRRHVFEALARAEVADEAKLNEAMTRALRDDGKLAPPLLVIGGELRFTFDEIAALKAALSIATPFAAADEGLKGAIDDAREFLRLMDYQCPPGVIEGFTSRVHEAFRKARRAAAPTYLEEQVERALLERRSFQTREVFGSTHLRALLTPASATRPVPLYLPDHAAKRLPLFVRFSARVLCEACLQEDQFEQHPLALRGFALARVQPMSFGLPAAPAKLAAKGG